MSPIAMVERPDGESAVLTADGRWLCEQDPNIEAALNLLCNPNDSGLMPCSPDFGKKEVRDASILLGAKVVEPERVQEPAGTVY